MGPVRFQVRVGLDRVMDIRLGGVRWVTWIVTRRPDNHPLPSGSWYGDSPAAPTGRSIG
jgi:hypothetical protein